MRILKTLILSLIALASVTAAALAQSTTTVTWYNNSSTFLLDSNGIKLSAGLANVNNDGALVQLGYFDAATAGNLFAGNWIALTGVGSSGKTTVGDTPDNSGLPAGQFSFVASFTLGSSTAQVYPDSQIITFQGKYTTNSSVTISSSSPAGGQILAIRFYDPATGMYNTMTSVSLGNATDNWIWSAPTPSGSTVSLSVATAFADGTLVWQDAANPFKTTITAAPEPTVMALTIAGLAAMGVRRRRLVSTK